MSEITVAEVRLRLNKALTTDDTEIQQMIDAAEAEYAEKVAPLTDATGIVYYGGTYPRNVTDVVVTDIDGNVVTPGSSYTASPYLYWNEPLGAMGHGLYGGQPNLFISYTAGALPANHREAIIADVAGYFEATQRGPAGLPGEGYEAAYTATPRTLFPRIQALAGLSIA